MKNQKLWFQIFSVAFLALLLTACGGSSDGESGGNDLVTGSWKMTTTVVSDECGDSAPGDAETITVKLDLNGNEVTMTVPAVGVESGGVRKGTMEGDKITFEDSGTDDEGPGTWTESITLTLDSSKSSFTGENNETQAGPNGENPCATKSTISGTRV